jgi:hypothetical protein
MTSLWDHDVGDHMSALVGGAAVVRAVRAELVRGGDARGAGQPPDEPPHGGFAEAAAVPVEEDGPMVRSSR